MTNCIFCKIIAGEMPSKKLHEDEDVIAFYDINPQAKVHFLVVPKKHIKSAADVGPQDVELIGRCFEVIAKLAKEHEQINDFRVITNSGEGAGQTVYHIHFHVLAGERLKHSLV